MKRAVLATLAAALLVAGCGGPSGDDPTAIPAATPSVAADLPATPTASAPTATRPAPTPTRAATPTPTEVAIDVRTPGTAQPSPTIAPTDQDTLQAELAKVLANTAALRELAPMGEVPAVIISREQLRENLLELLEKDYSQAEADADALGYWLLRLVPDRDLDLYQLQLDLLSEQVAGYYDPETDELFIVSDSAAGGGLDAAAEYTASHEYVHALQDQHFDLEQVRAHAGEDADRDLGATALVEGDATLTSTLYLFQYMDLFDAGDLFGGELGSTSVLDEAPPYIAQALIFPYEQGTEFATQLYLEGGNAALDAALEDPPTSSEQILHPEKYTAATRDEPLEVTLPDLAAALGPGWAETDADSLGEFDLRVLLAENGAPDPEGGAAGWGGARFALLQNGEQAVVALRTVWDTRDDAAEFHAALLATLPAGLDANRIVNDGARYIGIARDGDAVIYVAGDDAAAVGAALAALGGTV